MNRAGKIRRYILREERGGGGFIFDRETGQAEAILPEDMASKKQRSEIDIIPLVENAPLRARAAPFCLWFELTRRCNLKCDYCGQPDVIGSQELPVSELRCMFEAFAICGVFEIRFTGGEPTIRQDFTDIVESASGAGLFVSVNTNGVISTDRLDQMLLLPISLYIVSLDGPSDVHNSIRKTNSYKNTIRTIKKLVASGKRVRINTILTRENKRCLSQFVGELESLGVEALTLIPLRPAGRAKKEFRHKQLTSQELSILLDEVQTLRSTTSLEIAASYDLMSEGKIFNTPSYFTKRCVAGVEAACIAPNGELRACILLDDESYVIGRLTETSFQQLWADDRRWGIFRDESRLSQRCKACKFFSSQCPGTCQVISSYFDSPEVDPYCQLVHTG